MRRVFPPAKRAKIKVFTDRCSNSERLQTEVNEFISTIPCSYIKDITTTSTEYHIVISVYYVEVI